MTQPAAILFDFIDSTSAWNAFTLLQELGYEPTLHTAIRLHIHVIDEDLTSALEIVQAHGGHLVDEANDPVDKISFSALYRIADIAIPAHLVNEDIIEDDDFLPSIEGVNNFSPND